MEQQYRSRLNALPENLKVDIAAVVHQWGMSASHRRDAILEAFNDYKTPVQELGTGTNRLAVKYSNFALKIALDDEGIDDNRQEWVMSDRLKPGAAEAFEISCGIVKNNDNTFEITGGHLLVADYVPALTSYGEMMLHQNEILAILSRWSKTCLLGDVGLTKKNFANWGMKGNVIKCIDYAYVYPVDMSLFTCKCGSLNLEPERGKFTDYICKDCKTKYSASELRGRITNERRHEMFSHVIGLKMMKEYETFDVDEKYLHILKPTTPTPSGLSNQNNEFEQGHKKILIGKTAW